MCQSVSVCENLLTRKFLDLQLFLLLRKKKEFIFTRRRFEKLIITVIPAVVTRVCPILMLKIKTTEVESSLRLKYLSHLPEPLEVYSNGHFFNLLDCTKFQVFTCQKFFLLVLGFTTYSEDHKSLMYYTFT